MKRKTIFMATILFAIGAAVATDAIAKKPFTIRYQPNQGECKSFNTSECDGPNTNMVCDNVFAQPNCTGLTYRSN
jgi:hypothetical protein